MNGVVLFVVVYPDLCEKTSGPWSAVPATPDGCLRELRDKRGQLECDRDFWLPISFLPTELRFYWINRFTHYCPVLDRAGQMVAYLITHVYE